VQSSNGERREARGATVLHGAETIKNERERKTPREELFPRIGRRKGRQKVRTETKRPLPKKHYQGHKENEKKRKISESRGGLVFKRDKKILVTWSGPQGNRQNAQKVAS